MQMVLMGARPVTFGEFIRRERGRWGLLQQEVADAIDRPTSYVSRLERDQFKELPSPSEMAALAQVLRCSEEDLLRAAGYLQSNGDQDDPGTDSEDDSARIYTMLERNTSLTSYQKQIIRMALDDAARRRRELEGE